jgi:DNA-binding transcriptional regulator PaaX
MRGGQKQRGESGARGLTKALLTVLAGGAVITTALVFPGAGYLYKLYKKEQWDKARKRGSLTNTIKRLERQKFISWSEVNGELRLMLTEEGKKKTLQFDIDNLQIKKPVKWDKHWRVIVFDIPEHKRIARNIFRRKLKDLEFQQLQKSVFVSRFECKDEIDFLRHSLEIAPFVHYILAKDISGVVRR